MATLVLFSGGCNSGKTTTLKAVASELQRLGCKVQILDEIIRKEIDVPIDQIRKDAKAYLQLQDKIIRAKIKQEIEAIEDKSDCIYLADRAVTDSMFYLENYVNKSELDEDGIELLCNLHKYAHEYLQKYACKFELIAEFSPVEVKEKDDFRPAKINVLKDYEKTCISNLNYVYTNGYRRCNYTYINFNLFSSELAVSIIVGKIKYLKYIYEKANK